MENLIFWAVKSFGGWGFVLVLLFCFYCFYACLSRKKRDEIERLRIFTAELLDEKAEEALKTANLARKLAKADSSTMNEKKVIALDHKYAEALQRRLDFPVPSDGSGEKSTWRVIHKKAEEGSKLKKLAKEKLKNGGEAEQ